MQKHLGRRRTIASLPLTGQRTGRNTVLTYEILPKKIHCKSYLLTLFSLFVIVVKHSLSCLMYCKKHYISGMGMKLLRS